MTNAAMAEEAILKRLLVLACELLQAADRRAVLTLVGKAVPEVLGCDGAAILAVAGERDYLMEFDGRGAVRGMSGDAVWPRYARRAMRTGEPVVLLDPDAAIARAEDSSPGPVSLLAFPFQSRQPLGTLLAFWQHRQRPETLVAAIPTLRRLGELAGAALGNAGFRQSLEGQVAAQSQEIAESAQQHAGELRRRDDAEEEIRLISVTDVLTGMLNRRGFFLQAEQGFRLARRRHLPSALLFVDIDGLKEVNDTYGHDAGDRLIERTARILLQSFRDSDIVARLGGDEFAAFTLDSAQPQAIVARIEHNLESSAVLSDLPCRLSLSTGIVLCDPASELSLSDYLALADRQMYEQKKTKYGGRGASG